MVLLAIVIVALGLVAHYAPDVVAPKIGQPELVAKIGGGAVTMVGVFLLAWGNNVVPALLLTGLEFLGAAFLAGVIMFLLGKRNIAWEDKAKKAVDDVGTRFGL